MKSIRYATASALLLALPLAAPGGAMTGTGARESLVEKPINRWSVGADYMRLKRDVEFDAGPSGEFDSEQFYGLVAYDAANWASLFGTIGQSDATFEDGEEGDFDLRWSVGAEINVWSMDIRSPEFMEGILSLEAGVEYGQGSAGFDGGDAEWTKLDLVLPVHYEVAAQGAKDWDKIPIGMDFYVGPALSWLEGETDTDAGTDDFSEKQSLGVVAGAHLFLSYNLCVGAQLDFFDGLTYRLGLRYHF